MVKLFGVRSTHLVRLLLGIKSLHPCVPIVRLISRSWMRCMREDSAGTAFTAAADTTDMLYRTFSEFCGFSVERSHKGIQKSSSVLTNAPCSHIKKTELQSACELFFVILRLVFNL